LNINYLVEDYKQKINNNLSLMYQEGPDSLKETFDYVLNSKGKRIRPILTLLTADACNGDLEKCLPAALSLELLHNFTLVHDDIMDNDILRRGIETVHEKWDLGTAVLSGDLILSVALKNLSNNYNNNFDVMNIFTKGLLAVCEGQALDKEYENTDTIDIDEYLKMIDLKTGCLLGMCTEIGAKISNADLNTSQKLKEYGLLIGRGFQIQDDYLEIFSNSNQMGKSLESDILLNKKTFLMILAKEQAPNLVNDAINVCKEDFVLGIKELRKTFINVGIKDYTEKQIDKIFYKANSLLLEIMYNMNNLKLFTDYLSKRKK